MLLPDQAERLRRQEKVKRKSAERLRGVLNDLVSELSTDADQ
jgi:hypothetical protein